MTVKSRLAMYFMNKIDILQTCLLGRQFRIGFESSQIPQFCSSVEWPTKVESCFLCSLVNSFLFLFSDPAPLSARTTKYNVKNKNLLPLPFNWLTYHSLPNCKNVNIGSAINCFVWFRRESDLETECGITVAAYFYFVTLALQLHTKVSP